jgi:hypothetical protein
MAKCPRCAHEFFPRLELPLDPLFRLDVAAELIPFVSAESLRRYLNRRHPDWKRFYRVIQGGGRRTLTRFITAEQVRILRDETVRSTWSSPKRKRQSQQQLDNCPDISPNGDKPSE